MTSNNVRSNFIGLTLKCALWAAGSLFGQAANAQFIGPQTISSPHAQIDFGRGQTSNLLQVNQNLLQMQMNENLARQNGATEAQLYKMSMDRQNYQQARMVQALTAEQAFHQAALDASIAETSRRMTMHQLYSRRHKATIVRNARNNKLEWGLGDLKKAYGAFVVGTKAERAETRIQIAQAVRGTGYMYGADDPITLVIQGPGEGYHIIKTLFYASKVIEGNIKDYNKSAPPGTRPIRVSIEAGWND